MLRVADRRACQRGVVVVQRFYGVGIIVPVLQEVNRHEPRSLICCIFTMREGFYCPLRVRNENGKRRRQMALLSGVGVSEKVHSHDNIDELHTVESS